MGKQIYYITSCDDWKSYDSMRLLMITTSKLKVKKFISKQIHNGNMQYGDTDLSPNKQAKQWESDWKYKTNTDLNSLLVYGAYYYTHDGEEM